MLPPARACVALVAAVWLAASAGAEVYRWRDASGREHFAQQLHQVPAEHRAAAEAARESGEAPKSGGGVSFHDAPPPRDPHAGGGDAGRGREPAPPAALAPGAGECHALQREVARKQKVIRTHRGSVEANQRWGDDIGRSAFSRRRYEVRAEEEARWLARAEEELTRFIDAQRRKGVPPGCLR